MRNTRSIVVCVAVIAAGLIALASPAAAAEPGPHLSTLTTVTGHVGYSADGLGQNGTGGTIQAEVPGGSTVENAYLYGTYFGYVVEGSAPSESELTITVDSTDVVLDLIALDSSTGLATARADVTSLVGTKVGTGAATPTDFAINSDPFDEGFQRGLDGVGLVVIYSNPGLPSTTISVVDGAADPAGDSATFSFPSFPSGGSAQMSLGIGFSFQGGENAEGTHECGTGSDQSSEVDIVVGDDRLTSCAGNYDDGVGNNGALISVGGVSDSTDNPVDPFQHPADGLTPRVLDDELYNLSPFIAAGDESVSINTKNPSFNDNLFLAVVQTDVAQHTLTVTKNGSGTGTVTSSPAGIDCGATCSADFDSGTEVVLTAVAASGSRFSGWSDESCPGTGTCTVTMNGDMSVTATFVKQYTLTVSENGTGSGTVTSSPAGISCPPTCSAAYDTGTSVVLSAQAASGSTFSGWSGGDGCSGTGTCTVVMSSDKAATASFNQNSSGDSASGQVPPGGSIQTCQGTTSTDNTCSLITLPNTGFGATITITEQAGSLSKVCNGPCSNQTTFYSITCTPATPCYTNINSPVKVILRYRVPGTSTAADMYFQHSSTTKPFKIPNCLKIGIAKPNPCVSARNRLGTGNNDLQVQVLVTSDDPIIGKR
jgi:hypothetical protein